MPSSRADDLDYTLRLTLCGWVVRVRERVPGPLPGMWQWGRWRAPRNHELIEAMRRLTGG